jgi:hypothetical protein
MNIIFIILQCEINIEEYFTIVEQKLKTNIKLA